MSKSGSESGSINRTDNGPDNGNAGDAEEKVRWVQGLADSEGAFESPININLTTTVPLELPSLIWHHHELTPKKMKLTNTGHTLILSAKWHQERPFLSDGPLLGNYVFSQLHFHWGCNDMEGSEHTIDGGQMPLEMHVVHFKSCYLTQEAALKEKDGMVVLAYFFKLQGHANPAIQVLVDAIVFIQKPHCSARLDPLPLSFLLRKFIGDYFLYWGSVTTSNCVHLILWLLSREPIGISAEQLETFRSMLDTNEEPLIRNYRNIQPLDNRRVFHVSPGGSKYATLLPVPREERTFAINSESKNPRQLSSKTQTTQVYRMEAVPQNAVRSNKKCRNESKNVPYECDNVVRVNSNLCYTIRHESRDQTCRQAAEQQNFHNEYGGDDGNARRVSPSKNLSYNKFSLPHNLRQSMLPPNKRF